MALRLIEIMIPKSKKESLEGILSDKSVIGFWQDETFDTILQIKALLPAENTEDILDELERNYKYLEDFRVILLPVEATLPRHAEKIVVEESEPIEDESGKKKRKKVTLRISREELFAEINDSMSFNRVYVAMVVLSAVVAAIGLLRDNVAVVIGAMVIAPLLGPNVGLAFATTLGDIRLARRALKTNILGVLIAFTLSVCVGFLLEVNPDIKEIASRTEVHLFDIVLALASGSAGVLAFTSGASTALIGVMVAVALMPPLVAVGLLVGSGHFILSLGALLLLLTNLICVNLAGVMTFLWQGIQPRTWWETSKAKKSRRLAISLWTCLLVVLVVVIYLSQQQ